MTKYTRLRISIIIFDHILLNTIKKNLDELVKNYMADHIIHLRYKLEC